MSADETAAVSGDTGKSGSLPFNTGVAHQARIYDYLLGGKDNYAADRVAGEEMLKWRTRDEVARFFEGMDLAEPGLVRVDDWRPESGTGDTHRPSMWAAVGRKR